MDLKKIELFREWIPIRGYWRDAQAFVDWCFVGKDRLTEPFFDDSITKRLRKPFNQLFRHQTPLEFLRELNESSEGLKPDGFIFHLSRCGSTLVSQMLAALPQNIVISEAAPVDFVIRSPEVSVERRIEWLQWMLNALGQKRSGEEKNFFVKFDSWSTLEIDLVRQAYPDVPWIFMYRNPVEIIVSQLRQRGWLMIPGAIREIMPELSLKEAARLPAEEYCARVLAKVCRSVANLIRRGEGLPVDYSELPGALNNKILKHFNVDFSENDAEKMFSATRFNAKHPNLDFSADTERKKKEASPAAIAAAERFVNPFYEEFESIRKSALAN